MTISKDLFLSILAMDAYNRGYDAGIADQAENDPDGLGYTNWIGAAKINSPSESGVDLDEYQVWQDNSFYALSYEITGNNAPEGLAGKTVVSFRGDAQFPELGCGLGNRAF